MNELNKNLFLLLCLAALFFVFTCTEQDEENDGQGAGADTQVGWEQGCSDDAADVCNRFFDCTGIVITGCANAICDMMGQPTRSCILNVQDCGELRDCLPSQGDGGLFGDDPDDDDDTNDDDDDDIADDDDDTTDDDDDTADDDDDTTGPTQLLVNGDFDQGPSVDWLEISSGSDDIIVAQNNLILPAGVAAQSGAFLAYMGGEDYALDELYQAVTIPPGTTSGQIECHGMIITEETSLLYAYDFLTLEIQSTSGTTLIPIAELSNLNESLAWVSQSWNVPGISTYAGQQVRIHFEAENDFSNVTHFMIDTCSFIVQ